MIQRFKQPVYWLTDYILKSGFFRETFWKYHKDLFQAGPTRPGPFLADPYHGPEREAQAIPGTSRDNAPIFITARFRSGSTFLWQLFRALPDITAYYEPLNENRWFLNLEYRTDPSHIGATDYDREYAGLSHLDAFYDENWIYKNFHMAAQDHDPNLVNYIQGLISATDKRPVLQFNRMDFRLQWLRAHFPSAILLHLYRDPRQQWMSIQKDGGLVSRTYKYAAGDHFDLFYLFDWVRDLRRMFPFLEPEGRHPYALHYYLWRMSYIYGRAFCDLSICYEELVENFSPVMDKILDTASIPVDSDGMENLGRLNTGKAGKTWDTYADAGWFEEIEQACDHTLRIFWNGAGPC